MRRFIAGVAATAALLAAPAAQAAVTYTFTGSQTLNLGPVDPDDPDGAQIEVVVNSSFTLVTPGFITNGTFTPDSCTDDNAGYVCGQMEFDNFANQFNVGGDFLSLGYSYEDDNTAFGGGAFYFFAPGAFGAAGTYTNVGWPINGQPISDEPYGCCFGNAGFATLVVSGSPTVGGVPEPGAWALMILGFGGVGATLRNRRRIQTFATA
ncbi:PEPxxWA-CTERM sorting domain-containing protein [Phenylobacterium sp. SCN 70-31]|uniref:PEPxxWA-CTERM sorting domain-containing protein n=1 Tax=Phenylobacterium sp. SCN 70-31 TaxID=1660129 RepID=UPI000ABF7B55|nr:PEPxxWA-CTERM sorting domain-containing protein [Phenylobacterium sp. SCN 70-31]